VKYRADVTHRVISLAREYAFDALVVVFIVVTQIQVWNHADHPHGRLSVLALLTAGPLLFRRRAPFAAVLVTAVGAAAFTLIEPAGAYDTSTMFFILLLASWAAGSILNEREAAGAFAAILGASWLVMLRAPELPWTEVLWISLPLTGVFVLSVASSRRAEQVRVAEARAERSEQDAERAVEEERARISRELHDVVAHSVSVMTVQAGAVRRLLKPEQEREREALQIVEETGRQALTEMRRLLGMMRTEGETAALQPQPGLKTLDRLVEHVREAGMPVELTVQGEPFELPPGIDLSAYRIVQEALTNALRHGAPARAWVGIRYGADGVEVDIQNDGRVNGDGDPAGLGLIGMRERVAMCGGKLEAGPRDGGGYRISARLPVTMPSA
jgi:signal transduction histidine kinase